MALIDKNQEIICPRIEAVCPHFNPKSPNKRTCFIMMAYEEEYSSAIEKILKNAVKTALKLRPVLSKEVKKLGSTDMFCTKICKEMLKSTYCIADITYKNINVAFECGLVQGLCGKPVIITQYTPKKSRQIKTDEKKTLEKLKKTGIIQYSLLPLDIASDLSGIFNIKYSDEKELKERLKKAMEIKK